MFNLSKGLSKLVASLTIASLLSSFLVVLPASAELADWAQPAADFLGADTEGVDGAVEATRYDAVVLIDQVVDLPACEDGFNLSFTDVPAEHDARAAVERAACNEIVFGQGGKSGAPSDTFAGDQPLLRAEVVQMLDRAFNWSEAELPELTMTGDQKDEIAGKWYENATKHAYQAGIIKGFGGEGNILGMDRTVKFNDMYVMSCRAAGGAEGEKPACPLLDKEVEEVVDADVMASANDLDGDYLPKGAQSVTFGDFALKTDSPVTITGMTFERLGSSKRSNFGDFFVYSNGVRLNNNGKTISSSDDTSITFTGLSLALNSTEDVQLIGSVSGTSVVSAVSFQLADVTFNTNVAVSGLPVEGPEFNLIDEAGGSVRVAAVGTLDDPVLGTEKAEVAKFKVDQVSGEAVRIERIVLENRGNADTEKIEAWYLEANGEVISTGVVNGDYIGFELDPMVELAEGGEENFTVLADLGGQLDNGDTINLRLSDTADFLAVGKELNFGVLVTTAPAALQTVTIKAGTVTFSSMNTPTTGEIPESTTNVSLLDFNLSTGSDINIDTIDVVIAADDQDGLGLANQTITFNTAAAAADVVLNDADGLIGTSSANITNIRIMNRATGEPLTSGEELSLAVGANDQAQLITINDGIELAGNTEPYELSIVADIEDLGVGLGVAFDTAFAASLELSGALAATPTLLIEDVKGDAIPAADIVPTSDIEGHILDVVANSVDVAAATIPAAQTYIQGQDAVDAGGFAFTASDTEDMELQSLTVTFAATDGVPAALASKDIYESVALFDEAGTRLTEWKSITVANTVGFTSLMEDFVVAAGSTKKLIVKANVSTTAPYNTPLNTITASIASNDHILFETVTGHAVSETGAVATANTMTIAANGTLTVSAPNNPTVDLVVGGSTADVLELKFESQDEAYVVEDMQFIATSLGNNEISKVNIEYTNEDGDTVNKSASISATLAKFTGEEVYVPADGNSIVKVSMTLNTVDAGADSGDTVSVDFDFDTNFRAIAQGSGESTITVGTANIESADFIFVDSRPVFAVDPTLAPLSLTGAEQSFTFTVGAEGNSDISLARTTVRATLTNDGDGAAISLGNFRLYRNGTSDITELVGITHTDTTLANNVEAANTPAVANNASASTDIIIDFTNLRAAIAAADPALNRHEEVSTTEETTYTLKFTPNAVSAFDSLAMQVVDGSPAAFAGGQASDGAGGGLIAANALVWSDQSGDSVSGLHAYNTDDWNNGFHVEELASKVQSWD